jgi:dimethylaniline monooxygenase (N-oxide forming)
VENIAVLGGGKSSADMAYSAVKAGKNVNWILKATETSGPGFLLSPEGKGPYKNAFEIAMTRIASTFTPSFMSGQSWWTTLLHSTKCGAKLTAAFWAAVDVEIRKEADFEDRECLQGFDKFKPHSPYVEKHEHFSR